jgi:hypothetical protein
MVCTALKNNVTTYTVEQLNTIANQLTPNQVRTMYNLLLDYKYPLGEGKLIINLLAKLNKLKQSVPCY